MDEEPCEKLSDQKEGILKVISTNDIKSHESRKGLGIKTLSTTTECNFCNNVSCNGKCNYLPHYYYYLHRARCLDCGRWILYSEEEQHKQTCHAKKKTIPCKYCSWLVSESEIKMHEKSCIIRKCRHCLCTFSMPSLKDHEDLCALKQKRGHAIAPKCKSCNNVVCSCDKYNYKHYMQQRDQCLDCGQWILYSEVKQHKQTCHAKKNSVPCKYCSWMVPESEIKMHEKSCKIRYFLHSKKKTVPCKYCSWLVSESEIKMHEKSCNTRKCRHCSSTFTKPSLKDHEDLCALKQKREHATSLKCKLCNNVVCSCEKYNYNHYMQQRDQCLDCGGWILHSEDQQHKQTCHAKKKIIQCKYCSWLASESEMKLHENSCNARKCRYCQCSFTKPTLKYHEDLCALKQKRRHATSLKCRFCNNLVCTCNYDLFVKQRDQCLDCGRWVLYSEEQQHKQICHAKKKTVPCKYCSCTFSEHSLKDHEYVCALKRNQGFATFQLCLKCKRYFRQDTFSQHKCKHNVKPQSLTYSTPEHNAINTQVLVISPVTIDNNTQGRCALEARTEIESNHFQDGVIYEVPNGITHRLPNEITPVLPAGVIEITPIVQDPIFDSISSVDITSLMTKQKGIEIESVVSIKQEAKDTLHNVSGKDCVASDVISGSKAEQIEPILTISNVQSLETKFDLLHQEPIESNLNVALEVTVLTTDQSKQTDQISLIEEQMEPMPNIAKFHPVKIEDNVQIQEPTDPEQNVPTLKPMESVSCEQYGDTTDHSKQVDQFDSSSIAPETGEFTKTKGFKGHKWYRKRSYCKKYRNRVVANLANFGSKPLRPLKKTKQCPLCYKTFSKRNLAKHLKRNCDKGFLRKHILREHDYATSKRKSLHSRASLMDLLTPKTGNEESIRFVCSVCRKHFVSPRALVGHMRKVHIVEPAEIMGDNNKLYATRNRTPSKMIFGKQNNKRRRPYSRCLMCLCWFRGIEEHLWMCKTKRPCLNRVIEITTPIKEEPLDSTNCTNVLGSIVVQPAEQSGELRTESELKSLMHEPDINMNYVLSSSCDRSSKHSGGGSLFSDDPLDDLEAVVQAEEEQREHRNVLERKRRRNVKETFTTLKKKNTGITGPGPVV